MVESPRVAVSLKGKFGATRETAIIDTGYTGGVVIPLETALKIGMDKVGEGIIELADGTNKTTEIFTVGTTINGVEKDTTALVMGNEVLVGMAAIQPFRVCVDGGTRKATLEEANQKRVMSMVRSFVGGEK